MQYHTQSDQATQKKIPHPSSRFGVINLARQVSVALFCGKCRQKTEFYIKTRLFINKKG